MADYKDLLRDPRWQKRRLEIFQRDNWKCVQCDAAAYELQVHHEQYCGLPWEAPDDCLKTLCVFCHQCIEFLKWMRKNRLLLRANNFSYSEIDLIIRNCANRLQELPLNLEVRTQYINLIKNLFAA